MGVMNHNAIIVTTWNEKEVLRIKTWINNLTEMKTLFLFGQKEINGITTIVMVPDGSKEGWPESVVGALLRNLFIRELEKADYDDGSNPWSFVEVGYGEFGQKVLRGNCENCYSDSEYAGE